MKLARESEALQEEHAKLQTEASKWVEVSSDSDLIILARELCSMMMDMSDFTRCVCVCVCVCVFTHTYSL